MRRRGHIFNVCLEPGLESLVCKRALMVIYLTKDIIKQGPGAKIIMRVNLSGHQKKMHTFVTIDGLTHSIRERTIIHRYYNKPDRILAKNIVIIKLIVENPIN